MSEGSDSDYSEYSASDEEWSESSESSFSPKPRQIKKRKIKKKQKRSVLRQHHPQGNQTRNKIGNIRRGKGKLQVKVAVPLQVKAV